MRVSVMVTDGGPHPSDKLAEQSAGEIMDLVKVDPDRAGDTEADRTRKSSARKIRMYLEADILGALEDHHQANQDLERSLLAEDDERLHHPLHPDAGALESAVNSVVAAATKYGEPWASAFADEGARSMIHQILDKHFRSAIHIERSWHVDRQGFDRSEAAKRWWVKHHGGGNPNA